MENFNRVLSFALGLVVVVVFLAVISGKIDLRKRVPQLFGGATNKVTMSPTPTTTISNPEPTSYTLYQNQGSSTKGQPPTAKTIPATGSPTVLISLLFSAFAGGAFLRSAAKPRDF